MSVEGIMFAMQKNIEAFRQDCIDGIRVKLIPKAPQKWESVHDEGVNMGMERAIGIIEGMWKEHLQEG